jgi:hypothetical protein
MHSVWLDFKPVVASSKAQILTGLTRIHRAQIRTTPGAPHIAQGEKLKR